LLLQQSHLFKPVTGRLADNPTRRSHVKMTPMTHFSFNCRPTRFRIFLSGDFSTAIGYGPRRCETSVWYDDIDKWGIGELVSRRECHTRNRKP